LSLCITKSGAYSFVEPQKKRIKVASTPTFPDPSIETVQPPSTFGYVEYAARGLIPKNVDIDLASKKINITYQVVYNRPLPVYPAFDTCDNLITNILPKLVTFGISYDNNPGLYVWLIKGGLSPDVVASSSSSDVSIEKITQALQPQIEKKMYSRLEEEKSSYFELELINQLTSTFSATSTLSAESLSQIKERRENAAGVLFELLGEQLPVDAGDVALGIVDLMEFCGLISIDGEEQEGLVTAVSINSDEKYIEYTVTTPTGRSQHRFPLPSDNISFMKIPLSPDSPVLSLLVMDKFSTFSTQERMEKALEILDNYVSGEAVKIPDLGGILAQNHKIREELEKKEVESEKVRYTEMGADAFCANALEKFSSAFYKMINSFSLVNFLAFVSAFVTWFKCMTMFCASYPAFRVTSLIPLFSYMSLYNLGGQFVLCFLRRWLEIWFAVADIFEGWAFGNCALAESGFNQLSELIRLLDCGEITKQISQILKILSLFYRLLCNNWLILIIGCIFRMIRDVIIWLFLFLMRLLLFLCCGLSDVSKFFPGCENDCPK